MKLNPRSNVVAKAKVAIDMVINDISSINELTYAEKHQILALHMASDCKYMIRQERHPNEPDKGGDEA